MERECVKIGETTTAVSSLKSAVAIYTMLCGRFLWALFVKINGKMHIHESNDWRK